ncbi:MAG: coenzyme F420-0:L-glutamate ligase [Candidatus Atribacteria bacterium]|nr:coenzyme F420-0:L-glutamate ligase [Candidatus Atribacteria bacterium]
MTLTFTPLPHLPLICLGDNLADMLLASLQIARITLEDGDILVVSQKIVSKTEGRLVNLATVTPSKEAIELAKRSEKDPRLVELILRESKEVLRVRVGTIIVEHRLGFICASAGIDHSNVRGEDGNPEDWVLLLPEDPDRSALEIRRKIKVATGNRIGVMIIDSHGRAWRLGTIGTAIGISGLPAVVDKRGWQDLFGYRLKITIVAAADELAAAASLVMGEAAEGIPAVHVRGFPYPLRESSLNELIRSKENDLFR